MIPAERAQRNTDPHDVDIWLTSDAREALDARQTCELLQGDGTTAYFACPSADADTTEKMPFTQIEPSREPCEPPAPGG